MPKLIYKKKIYNGNITLNDVIDDTATSASQTWSSQKISGEITNASKRFPDYARGVLTTLSYDVAWTATEDCYFHDTTITHSDTPPVYYTTYVNGVNVTSHDSTPAGDGVAMHIFTASGFMKRGDKILGSPRCKIYGLKA